MTERPILFSAEMLRAILKGGKTQTRRKAPIRELNILQHPGDRLIWSVSFLKAIKGTLASHSGGKFSDLQARSIIASQFNPYGWPGDLLWVRETWFDPQMDGGRVLYAADQPEVHPIHRRRPAIHMPRWASRITLRITDVRVERLQDISEDDARAEGWPGPFTETGFPIASPLAWFANVWTNINGSSAWDDNPWVWALSFERVKP